MLVREGRGKSLLCFQTARKRLHRFLLGENEQASDARRWMPRRREFNRRVSRGRKIRFHLLTTNRQEKINLALNLRLSSWVLFFHGKPIFKLAFKKEGFLFFGELHLALTF